MASTASQSDPFKEILATQARKQEFTLLVLLCANVIRQNLANTFDASHTSARPSKQVKSLPYAEEAPPPSYNSATNGRGRQDYDRRDEELSSEQTRELRRHALAACNAWRTKLLRRMGEVLNVKSEVVLAEKARRDALRGDEDKTNQSNGFYATVPTSLVMLPQAEKEKLLSSLLLLILSLEAYSAYSRVLLCHVCYSLGLPQDLLSSQEATTAKGLLTAAENMNAEAETAAAANSNATGRAWKVGLAAVAGAALIGITGGLAAPFLAAGVGGIFGAIGLGGTAAAGLLGGLAGNVVLIGGLFGAYGGRMTGGLMDKYAAEISDFAFIPAARPGGNSQHHLRVGIEISGWLTTESEVTSPWSVLSSTTMESFALRWELSLLLELGTSLAAIAQSYVWGAAKAEILNRTILASLAAGLWPLGLIRVARIAENPFSLAIVRADKAGELLADALINRAQGERPVSLIGYSLGARVIYSCLQSLAKRKAFGLIENAVLLGAPCPSDATDWRSIRAVCAGRVINIYSTNDFILAFLYRTSRVQFGVAGIEAIEEVAGVESWDVSPWVSGHTRYRYLIGRVLKEVGLHGLDENEIRLQAERLQQMDEEEAHQKGEAKERSMWSSGKKKEEGELIDFGDDDDNKQSARELTDHDISQRVQNMHIQDGSGTKPNLFDDSEPAPSLPPRPKAIESTKPFELHQQKPIGNKSSEDKAIPEKQTKESMSEMQSVHPDPEPVSDEEDDPFANRGIRMVDADDEGSVEREAKRLEEIVQRELRSMGRGSR